MSNQTLLIASTNKGKIEEISSLIKLYNLPFDVISLQNFQISEPLEPYETYLENAIHKAKYYASQTGLLALSDDSGFGVDILDGFPGVRTKDFCLECGGLIQTFQKLEELLKDHLDKSATFMSALALYDPKTQKIVSVETFEKGDLVFPARGGEGFGYDPLFIPEGYTKTMAELGNEIKNKISHRSKAFEQLVREAGWV